MLIICYFFNGKLAVLSVDNCRPVRAIV